MEQQDVQDGEATDILSDEQSNTRPDSSGTTKGPLPTDSMVTVRLSDLSLEPMTNKDAESKTHEDEQSQDEEAQPKADVEDSVHQIDEDAVAPEQTKHETTRDSVTSMPSFIEDEPSICTSGTLRSRSSSSGTSSSGASAQVDWDELERNEEQAPRDEGSDEVGYKIP